MEEEKWLPIAGWECLYEVSNLGRVKSLKRMVPNNGGSQLVGERILKPYTMRGGYLVVTLSRHSDRHKYIVHRLVGSAFIPNPKNKREINHKNGDKTDNRKDNLEWVSSRENKIHRHNVLYSPRSKSGVYGVEYDSRSNKWRAYSRMGGQKYIGSFSHKEDAIKAATEARIALCQMT